MPVAPNDPTKRTIMLTLGTIVVLAMTYGSGMSAEIHKIQAINETLKSAKSDLRVTQMDLRTSDALIQQLEARRQLDLALAALDQRNFGIAQQRLDEAAVRLLLVEQADQAAKAHPVETADYVYQPPVSTLDLSALAGQIKGTALATTPDIGAQRQQILGFVSQLDAQLGRVVLPADAPLPPVTVKPPTLNDVPETPGNDVTRIQ
jgi:hypothetical protein